MYVECQTGRGVDVGCKTTWRVPQPCHYFSSLPLKLRIKNNFHSQILSSPSPFSFSLLPVMPWVNFRTNCQPDHSLLYFLSPPLPPSPPPLASPFSIPSVVNHFCIVVCLLWLPRMVSMVCVREHDQLMETEPGVTYFPGTDSVLTLCTTNQTPMWCLQSGLGLAKNRKLSLVYVSIWTNKTYRHSWTLSSY